MRHRLNPWLATLALLGTAVGCTANPGAPDDPPAPPVTPAPRPEADAASPPPNPDGEASADADEPLDLGSREASPPRPPDPINVSACQRVEKGPIEAIMSVALYAYDAPEIGLDKVYRVQLPARASGHLSLEVTATGEHTFFAGTSSLTLFELAGLSLMPKLVRGRFNECPAFKARFSFELKPGRYVLRLGPEAAGMTDLYVTPPPP